jgi:hypothetical protein
VMKVVVMKVVVMKNHQSRDRPCSRRLLLDTVTAQPH